MNYQFFKRYLRLIPVLAISLAGSVSMAQNPAPTPRSIPGSTPSKTPVPSQAPTRALSGKIGFVDVEIVIEQSRAIRMGMDALDRDLSAIARRIDAKEREFRQKRFDMDRQERILTTDEREKRRTELVKLQEEIEQMGFEMDQQIRIRERQIEPVLELIMNRVADVAEEQNFDMVLRGEVVIYGIKTADLSDDVIRKLDQDVSQVLSLFKDEKTLLNEDTAEQSSKLPVEEKSSSASVTEISPSGNTTSSENKDLLPLIP